MNIIFVGIHCPHTARPLRFLLQAGHQVVMLTYGEDPLLGEKHAGYTCIRLPGGLECTQEIALLLQHLKKKFKPDILHVHFANYRVWQCTLLPIAPTVVSVWGSDINTLVDMDEEGRLIPTDAYDPLVEEGLRKAALVIVDDPAMVRKVEFMTDGSVPVCLNHLGVDDTFFEEDIQEQRALRHKLGLPEGIPVITSPRAFLESNGHELILRAFARVAKRHDAVLVLKTFNAMFWSPSTDTISVPKCQEHDVEATAYLLKMQKLATQLGVWRQTVFCGSLSIADLRSLYGLSTALVNMPTRDGFPVTFLEAAACKSEVVTCWHPAYAVPLVEKHFHVLPEAKAEVLAEALEETLLRPASLEARCAAQEEVRANWTHARYCRELVCMYGSMLETPATV